MDSVLEGECLCWGLTHLNDNGVWPLHILLRKVRSIERSFAGTYWREVCKVESGRARHDTSLMFRSCKIEIGDRLLRRIL